VAQVVVMWYQKRRDTVSQLVGVEVLTAVGTKMAVLSVCPDDGGSKVL
jgi:hypothetical protein